MAGGGEVGVEKTEKSGEEWGRVEKNGEKRGERRIRDE